MYCGSELFELLPTENTIAFNLCGICKKMLKDDNFEIRLIDDPELKKGFYNDAESEICEL